MPDRRMEVEALLRCATCQVTVYRLFRRQNCQADGTPLPSWDHVLWGVHPSVGPPRDPERLTCPDCDAALQRVAP